MEVVLLFWLFNLNPVLDRKVQPSILALKGTLKPTPSLPEVIIHRSPRLTTKPKLKQQIQVIFNTRLDIHNAPGILKRISMLHWSLSFIISHQRLVPVVMVIKQHTLPFEQQPCECEGPRLVVNCALLVSLVLSFLVKSYFVVMSAIEASIGVDFGFNNRSYPKKVRVVLSLDVLNVLEILLFLRKYFVSSPFIQIIS